jgi:hypothetical protein
MQAIHLNKQDEAMHNAKYDISSRIYIACVVLLFAGCVPTELEFKKNLDAHINWNIDQYQKIYGVDFIRSKERDDGMIEYFYEYTIQGVLNPKGSKSCYVMVVDEKSKKIASWHFIGEDEQCRVSNQQ